MVAGAVGILVALFFGVAAVNSVPEAARLTVVLVAGAMVVLFAAVILAGVLLLEAHPAGRILSSAVQLLQVPAVAAASWHWLFFAGAYLDLAWLGGQPRLFGGLKADLDVAWAGAQQVTGVGINVVPLIVLWLLWRRSSQPAAAALSESAAAGGNAPAA